MLQAPFGTGLATIGCERKVLETLESVKRFTKGFIGISRKVLDPDHDKLLGDSPCD
jgi:hypothetical protein